MLIMSIFKEIINYKLSNLSKCLLRCARQAEKQLNDVYATKNKNKRKYFRPDPEQLEQINAIELKLKV